jgi:hypothetical protein
MPERYYKVWNSINLWPVPRNFNFYLVCFRIYMTLDVSDNFAF